MTDDNGLRLSLRWAAVGELSCRVAHESNNLLAGVLGQAELGLLSKDPERMRVALEAIVRNARALKAVNERLVAFSRGTEPVTRSTSILEIFKDLYGLLERSFEKVNVRVERRFAPDIPTTWCEPGGVAQVILYALRVALEALQGSGGGSLILEAREDQGNLRFATIFEPPPGASLERPASRAGSLTIELAQAFAHEQSGTFTLERAGHGWMVACSFPVRRNMDGLAPAPVSKPEDRSTGVPGEACRPLSVLVVDDEGPMRDLVQEVLEANGCRVKATADGESALQTFGRGTFDFILTDIVMPGLDGVALIQRIVREDRNALIVVLTGRASDDEIVRALAVGAKAVLRKPFELSSLVGLVKSVREDPSGAGLQTEGRTAAVRSR